MDHDHNRNDGPNDANNNNDSNDNHGRRIYQTETFISGNGGPAFLTTMQNLVNQMMMRPLQPQDEDTDMRDATDDLGHSEDPPTAPVPSDTAAPGISPDDVPAHADTANPRPIRPLPRPHAHFHAHTPVGIIDLFTFNIAGPPPPPPPGTATFTFNIGPDVLAGFEAFFLNGMQKEREPDLERAKVLLRGMETVPEGLVRRLERAGGVPGGQGNEENACGCAVCWGPLLEEVEPGEWDAANRRETRDKGKEKEAGAESSTSTPTDDEDEFRGRIVALPCAHVYHAECLLPWFSRTTTCPTCRFDVDPESLTWNPQPPPPPPPETEGQDGQGMPFPFPFPFPFAEGNMGQLFTGEGNPIHMPMPNLNPDAEDANANNANANANRVIDPTSDTAPNPNPVPTLTGNPTADEIRRANAAEVARFNAFMNTIMNSVHIPQDRREGQQQGGEQPQPQVAQQQQPQPQATGEQPQPQLFNPAAPPPPPATLHNLQNMFRMPQLPLFIIPQGQGGQQVQAQEAQVQAQGQEGVAIPMAENMPFLPPLPSTAVFGPGPPESHLNVELPPLMIPFPSTSTTTTTAGQIPFSFPFHGLTMSDQAQAQAQEQAQPQSLPQPQPQPQQPQAEPRLRRRVLALAHPQYPTMPNAHTNVLHPNPNAHPHPHTRTHSRSRPAPPRERKPWTAPEPVGKTLRQRVETKERELGLRCDDVVCGVAPGDDDYEGGRDGGTAGESGVNKGGKGLGEETKTMIKLHAAYNASGRACEHRFHPGCLVTSARVVGEGGEGEVNASGVEEPDVAGEADAGGETEMQQREQADISVSCPVCRAEGSLTKGEWDEGVRMAEV